MTHRRPARTDRGADQFRQLTAGDIEVILPRVTVFSGATIGSDGAEDFEIVTVGPQEDLPVSEAEMRSVTLPATGVQRFIRLRK